MIDNPQKPSTVSLQIENDTGIRSRWISIVNLIRGKLRDYPELNRLTDGEESSNRQLAQAIALALDDFNSTPPLIQNYSISDFPSISLLVDMAIVQVLESLGYLLTRNNLSWRDGDVVISSNDKGPQLMQWAAMLRNNTEVKKRQLKIAINISGALDGTHVSSEYAFLDELFGEI